MVRAPAVGTSAGAAAFAVAGLLACASTVAGDSRLRGVGPQDLARYTPSSDGTWACLQSGERIPFSAVNDDYCDCADGSDEPGTSACPNATFYCANAGHLPASIRSSRVNDGICDPECCDGSDEFDGKVSCPNVCAKVGKEYRTKKAQLENVRRAGSKIRAKYIADAKKSVESVTAEIASLTLALGKAKEKEAQAKSALERAESADHESVERKQANPLFQTLTSHQEALRSLSMRNSELKRELEQLTQLLDDLARGYNPNYQDMAVKGAVMAYGSWKRGSLAADDEDSGDGSKIADQPAVKLDSLKDDGSWPADKVDELTTKDPLELLDAIDLGSGKPPSESGLLFRIHEYLPDATVPYFEAFVDTLLDLLIKANIISSVKRVRPNQSADGINTESVTKARDALNSASSEVRRLEGDLNSKQTSSSLSPEKHGKDGEFKALEGTCIEKNIAEYTYEFCFGGRAMQKPRSGMHVSLGSFARFDPDNKSSVGEEAYYSKMILENGQRCWNGPDRSVLVDLVCDTKNELLDVFEAEKCIYSMKVSTPAICFPPAADPAAGRPVAHEDL